MEGVCKRGGAALNDRRIRELLAAVRRPPGGPVIPSIADGGLEGFLLRTGIQIPADMANWLRITNGACVGPGGLFGIRPPRKFLDIERVLKSYPDWQAKKWLPVAGDGCGNYYVMPTNGEFGNGYPIVFIDTIASQEKPAYIVASDLEHFLIFLLESELGNGTWPFDERAVAAEDPTMTKFTGIPLPWEA